MTEPKTMTARRAGRIALVRGAAFALITGLYIAAGQPLSGYLWCVYVGFFLSVALGAEGKKWIGYAFSHLAGYAWAFLYMNLAGWAAASLGGDGRIWTVICELLLTGCLLFCHLYLLQRTVFRTVPPVFAAVALVFAFGGMRSAPLCAVSVLIGMAMAFVTGVIIGPPEKAKTPGEKTDERL